MMAAMNSGTGKYDLLVRLDAELTKAREVMRRAVAVCAQAEQCAANFQSASPEEQRVALRAVSLAQLRKVAEEYESGQLNDFLIVGDYTPEHGPPTAESGMLVVEGAVAEVAAFAIELVRKAQRG